MTQNDTKSPGIEIRGDAANAPLSCLEFNPDEYRKFVKDECLTPEEEDEVLAALWMIVVEFVKMGFGIAPLQLILDEHEKGGDDGSDD